ncbi:MAG: CotH kinase family protein [Deltaproteobacteria bacterium]|nr:CotH kinase family protein [Deltaproteobacteria bacterium]
MPLLSLLVVGCSADSPGAEPDGDPIAEPSDLDAAFPQDRVARLDLVLEPSDWQAMLEDMTGMLGDFGSGGTSAGPPDQGPEPPEEVLEACAAAAVDAPCSAVIDGRTIEGQCIRIPDGRLACAPGGGPPAGGDTDLIPGTPIWAPCTIAFEGRTWQHVGVRFKGNSSLRDAWLAGIFKLPLRLKLDEYEDEYPETRDQRFFGLKHLSLSNGARDPSLLRTKIGNDVFLDAGLPSQVSSFYRVFIDHGAGPVYFGLYVASEIPSDDAFLDRAFGAHEGNLYQPDGEAGTLAVWDEEGLGKENHEEEADFSDVRALFDALGADRTDPGSWAEDLEARFDVDLFLRWLALNTVVVDWDTYGIGPHNYYLYADPGDSGRFAWIPWDHSESLRTDPRALSLGLEDVDERWPLIRHLLDDAGYRARYVELVGDAAQGAFEPGATEDRLRAAHELIAPFVVGADGEQVGYTFLGSDEDFDSELERIVDHVRSRAAAATAFVDAEGN